MLKDQAKQYIRDMYLSHKQDDIEAWSHLIDVIFLYIDERIKQEYNKDDSLDDITQ